MKKSLCVLGVLSSISAGFSAQYSGGGGDEPYNGGGFNDRPDYPFYQEEVVTPVQDPIAPLDADITDLKKTVVDNIENARQEFLGIMESNTFNVNTVKSILSSARQTFYFYRNKANVPHVLDMLSTLEEKIDLNSDFSMHTEFRNIQSAIEQLK